MCTPRSPENTRPPPVGAGTKPKVDDRGTEDVTSRHEGHGSGAVEVAWLVEFDGLDLVQYRERVLLSVEGRDPAGVPPLLFEPSDLPFGVLLLDPTGIREQDSQQTCGRLGHQDRIPIARLEQQRQPS